MYDGSCQHASLANKFTGKERDSESGLDNFDFRYYASSLGRFMRPDEPFGGWDQNDPQTFNLYSYVRNSPTVSVDPDGHDCVYVGTQISVVRGDCLSDKDNGIYVNGTIDLNSFTYNPKNSSIGFSYTPDDAAPGTFGAGVIQQTPSRMDNGAASPGFLGPADVFFVRVPDLGIMSKIGELLGFGAKETTTVIGKMADLRLRVHSKKASTHLPMICRT
jgi:RHS repeat-associated protein